MDLGNTSTEESDGTGIETERGRKGVHRGRSHARKTQSDRVDTQTAGKVLSCG